MMGLVLMWLLACGADAPEPSETEASGQEASGQEAKAVFPLRAKPSVSPPVAMEVLEGQGLPWLGFPEVPAVLKNCSIEQKFGNPLFDKSLAVRCDGDTRLLAVAVGTSRWQASSSALATQAEGLLGEPDRTETTLGWTVKHWTEPRSAVTALRQNSGQTLYIGCVDGVSQPTCTDRVSQLLTGLGQP